MKSVGTRLREALPWIALLALGLWCRWPGSWTLLVASATTVAALLRPGPVSRLRITGVIVLLTGVVLGFVAQQRDLRLVRSWDDYWVTQEARVVEDLGRRLDQLMERSITSVATLAAEAGAGNLTSVERVASLRREAGLAALAVYDGNGRVRVWDGMHRGRVPPAVKGGDPPFLFGDTPLFSYLYVSTPTAGGGAAVGAVLLRADLPGRAGDVDDLSSSFRARTGETLRVSTPARARAAGVFDYMHEGNALFSLTVVPPSQAARRALLRERGQRAGAALALLAWLLLALTADPRRRAGTGPLAVGVGLALVLPVRVLPGLGALSGPGDVLLPGVRGGTLARGLLVLAFLVVWAGATRLRRRPRFSAGVVAAALGLALPALALWFGDSASVGFLAGGEGGWVAFQGAMAASFTLVFWIGLVVGPRAVESRRRIALALTLAVGLSLAAAWVAVASAGIPPWLPILWALPGGLALGVDPGRQGSGRIATWVVAAVLGATLAIPVAWGQRLEARIDSASARMDRLGTGVDPYLQFLLERWALAVDTLDAGGAPPVELLYRGWRNSGLAETGYPVWMTVWTPGGDLWEEELRIGMGSADRPVVANQFLDALGDTVEVRRFDSFEAHYLAQVPLDDGRVVTAVVPPLGTTGAESLLGPLFGSLGLSRAAPLRLVPMFEEDSAMDEPGGPLEWVRRGAGWQGERTVEMAGAAYHAHVDVPLSGPTVTLARGSLLLALDLVLLCLLWWLGLHLSHGAGARGGALFPAVTSFRARVTLALFAFFALSNLLFGSLAYRTIAGASQRASRVLAERAVNDAAASYFDLGRNVSLLASRVGVDVLEYRDGELAEGSVDELVALGLYEGWVPFDVHRALLSRESLAVTTSTSLGEWEYVTAYRRLPDGDIVGAPVPLQAGATAIQSRDVAELLTAAVLAGGALSFLLALLVGRALTRPIQTLRIASERVGSGNLGVRLPGERRDEFGAVFEAFNRMVRRLRRARRDLVRTSRRTQAIVEDAATGVLAFDAEGTVTLANPTARALLGLPIDVGEPLPVADGSAGEFVRWVDTYFRDGLGEASLELQKGERRIRVRARRISHAGPVAGAVVSLEDVTDELRTERILAWGEMARQVAHEVKNPLTPIKLSVQHLRRAWEDGRTDFGEILTRNAEAMLREIDRLAAIASSFSRFGAPRAVGEEPLSRVQLGSVVREVLALYGDGEGPVHFRDALDEGLPLVLARDSEVKEVLVNLLENARAAVTSGGTVQIEGEREGDAVVLRVVDDGSGIPEEFLGRIFEPHFSTRSAGTGLGLAIVHRLVTSWGAAVHVESREGEGTTVSIRFVVAEPVEKG